MTEVLFYHLERATLDTVLPALLEKCLDRGWRAVVQSGSPERLEALDATLWTYRDDSFLPHGRDGEPLAEHQPVLLTTGARNPHGAEVRFVVDGAEIGGAEGHQRFVYLFDGRDAAAVDVARRTWRQVKADGWAATYWQQDGDGRWQKRA